MMEHHRRWCRITLWDAQDHPVARRVLGGSGDPDLHAIELVAELLLKAHRESARVTLDQLSPEMCDLMTLCGLSVENLPTS